MVQIDIHLLLLLQKEVVRLRNNRIVLRADQTPCPFGSRVVKGRDFLGLPSFSKRSNDNVDNFFVKFEAIESN
jgi:hypothetical protein